MLSPNNAHPTAPLPAHPQISIVHAHTSRTLNSSLVLDSSHIMQHKGMKNVNTPSMAQQQILHPVFNLPKYSFTTRGTHGNTGVGISKRVNFKPIGRTNTKTTEGESTTERERQLRHEYEPTCMTSLNCCSVTHEPILGRTVV
jgi:hypothetical protein